MQFLKKYRLSFITIGVLAALAQGCSSNNNDGGGGTTTTTTTSIQGNGPFTLGAISTDQSSYGTSSAFNASVTTSINNPNIVCYWYLNTQSGSIVTYYGAQNESNGTCQITGTTPSTQGNYSLYVYATDNAGDTAGMTVNLLVNTTGSGSGGSGSTTYSNLVLSDSPVYYWQLADPSGSLSAADSSAAGYNTAYPEGANYTYTFGMGTGLVGDPTGLSLSGAYLYTTDEITGPQTFSVELWFSSNTDNGGLLIGFGDQQFPLSNNYDRHIYLDDSGYLHFGTYNGGQHTISSTSTYNDGNWHYVVGTLASDGMHLYVDGNLVASNSQASAQNISGWWHIGYDNLQGWTDAPASYTFFGNLAQMAVYNYELTSLQVANHYQTGSGN